ncbi:single-stranded DNA-binding protein [Plantibacter flavus]|uniref:single-stranded DNA-binding protein n=1 Tax=Plantibacter flavus TaxID=150123 RepID=UPI003F1522B7
MNDQITVRGHVATEPRHHRTAAGVDITSFRLASQQRRYDPKRQEWTPLDTNWYTVSAFRSLATAAASSLVKGQRVLVLGRVRIRDWQQDERRGTSVDIEADCIGGDIGWQPKPGAPAAEATTSSSLSSSVPAATVGGDSGWATAPPSDTPF